MTTKYRNFIYDAGRAIVFAYVPKVACSNWKCVLRYLAGKTDYLDTRLAHDRQGGGLSYLDQLPNPRAILCNTTIRKFACVRDPYGRILSAYLNKIEQRLPGHRAAAANDHFSTIVADIDTFRQTTLDPARYPAISFEVFLRWRAAGGSYFCRDEHWQCQSTLLDIGNVQFDFIGRFETLDADAANILTQMGCDIAFPSQAQIRFAPSGAQDKLAEYYDAACITLVDQIYASDFKAFKYSHRGIASLGDGGGRPYL